MKSVFKILFSTALLLLVVIAFNTARFTSKQIGVEPITGIKVDEELAVSRLSKAIRIPTVSHQNNYDFNPLPFEKLKQFIFSSYPNIDRELERKVINQYSLLYKWKGQQPTLKPVLFLAHLDVVPADPKTLSQWIEAPFSGKISDGYIWGRGTLDDKSSVFGLLEAVEALINQGFKPKRTILLAFGHDEELGGHAGAAEIAKVLRKNGIKAQFTLDEGMAILDKTLSPAKQAAGIIGIAEKGYVTIKLTSRAAGGHSSLPPKKTAIGALAKAISTLEEHQFPARLTGPIGKQLDYLGPEMPLTERLLFANRWLFEDIIVGVLEQRNSTAAMVKTTTALTMLKGGVKENALPSHASAIVNFRILPGDTSQVVLKHVTEMVNNPDIEAEIVRPLDTSEPSKVSATDTPAFATLGKTIRQIFHDTLFAPGLVLVATDSVHYEDIAENNYRFAPYTLGKSDLSRIHGIDEVIAVEDYLRMIQFYAQLMLNLN